MAATREQCMANLAKAQTTRLGRAALKKRLKSGDLLLEDVLDEVPDLMRTMQIHEILASLPGFAAGKSAAACRRARVDPRRSLERLERSDRYRIYAQCAS